MKRIGHKGADLIEPGNTPASFDAAREHGVHMIELDVLPERWRESRAEGELILAHDYQDAGERETLTLEQGLAHLASESFTEIDFIIDLKLPGYEVRVLESLRAAGLEQRSLISSTYRGSLAALRAAGTESRIGWSVPRAKRDYTRSPLMALPALGVLGVMRRVLPGRAAEAIAAGEVDALMAHWRLVSEALVEAVSGAGGDLFVWTVDHAPRIRELQAMGVSGVITNDPRLFGPLPAE
jgi:glycerophosphoryl diester phosphodiesterase